MSQEKREKYNHKSSSCFLKNNREAKPATRIMRSKCRTMLPHNLISSFMILLLFISILVAVVSCYGPLVKVCGARELKEVTESICSTLGKRDIIPFPSLLWKNQRRIKSKITKRVSWNVNCLMSSSNNVSFYLFPWLQQEWQPLTWLSVVVVKPVLSRIMLCSVIDVYLQDTFLSLSNSYRNFFDLVIFILYDLLDHGYQRFLTRNVMCKDRHLTQTIFCM